jgi:hypothetical protein
MKSAFKLGLAIAALTVSANASANPPGGFRAFVISMWCLHSPVINLNVYQCEYIDLLKGPLIRGAAGLSFPTPAVPS